MSSLLVAIQNDRISNWPLFILKNVLVKVVLDSQAQFWSSIILQYGDDDYVEKYIHIIKDFIRQIEIVEEFLAKD